jgi:hypothetical protein
MANRFPLVINNSSTLVGELLQGDAINLSLSGIFDGLDTGGVGNVLTSTGGVGVQWARAADVFVDDAQTLLNKEFLSSTFDGTSNTFLNIPNSGLSNPSILINGNSISLGGSVNTPNDNDNTTYALSIQDGATVEQKAIRLSAGGTGTGFQDNFIQYDTDPNNILSISRIGTDTLQFTAIVENLTLSTHLSFDSGTSYNGSVTRQIQTDATPSNVGDTIVSRNAAGDFSANIITANLTGNVTGNVTGSAGSVEQSLTVGSFLSFNSGTSYNGSIAREIQTNGTSSNNADTLVARDGSGNFSANQITANITGDVTGNADTATQVDVNEANGVITATEVVLSSTSNGIQDIYHSSDLTFDNTPSNKILTVNGTVVADEFLFSTGGTLVPTGVIQMWGGGSGTVPSGYQICNGSATATTELQAIVGSNVPDLRDRFIIGSGSTYSPGDTGGSNSVNLSINQMPSHSHSGNFSVGPANDHQHTVNFNTGGGGHEHTFYGRGGGSSGTVPALRFDGGGPVFFPTGGGGGHNHAISGTTSPSGAHSHSINGNTSAQGGNTAVAITPPYYALIYIIKT